MNIDYPHAVLTCQYYILGPRFDDVSTVKVNFFWNLSTTDSAFLKILIVNLELDMLNLQPQPLRFWDILKSSGMGDLRDPSPLFWTSSR